MSKFVKVALITGANRGLGFETARQLGRQGVTVILTARRLGDAATAAATLMEERIDARGIMLDVTKPDDRVAAAEYVAKEFGRLDILINNAAVLAKPEDRAHTASTTTEDELRYVYETNLFSVVGVTQTFLPLLRKSEAGRIVNLSSDLGSLTLRSDPSHQIYYPKLFSYGSSKTALNAFTVSLACELKDTPIKVNSVHPGWVKTEMGSDAAPMEIPEGVKTSVALALLGPDGPTGRFIHVDREMPW